MQYLKNANKTNHNNPYGNIVSSRRQPFYSFGFFLIEVKGKGGGELADNPVVRALASHVNVAS